MTGFFNIKNIKFSCIQRTIDTQVKALMYDNQLLLLKSENFFHALLNFLVSSPVTAKEV